nr:protein FAM27D1-like [Gorilla gorilla gorilla]
MGMRFQLLRERRISSRGPGSHTPKADPPRQKRLTAGLITQTERQKEAHQRQATMRQTALWGTGHIRPKTHTHTGIHTQTHRERERNTQRLRDRERRENGRHTHRHPHAHTHTHTESYSRGIETHTTRQPLRLRGSALEENDPRVREQPRGTQADLSSRSRMAARLLGRLTPTNSVRAGLRLGSRAASPVPAWGFLIVVGPL